MHHAPVLDRRGHRDDLLALVGNQHHRRAVPAGQCDAHLRIGHAVAHADLAVHRQLPPHQPGHEPRPGRLDAFRALLLNGRVRGIGSRKLSAREQLIRINDQDPVGGIDARADVGRQQAALEQGRHAVGRDRQLHGGDVLVPQQAALALNLRQHVRIEHDASRILLARRVGSDGRRDHFSLGSQTVALRLDQPRMILAQVEDAAEKNDEADHVGEDDPPQQRLGDKADERAISQELIEPNAPREIPDIAADPLASGPKGAGDARQI